jgi:hypothetical protein
MTADRMRGTALWRRDPRPVGRAVVVDIDGVLSDASTRQHFLNNPEGVRDWEGFFGTVGDDRPLVAVPALLQLLDPSVTVILLSGRPAWVAERTREWLERHGIRWDQLVVREGDDVMDPASFKRDVVVALRAEGWDVVFAFDDNEGIVEMFVGEGIPTLYVHSGYYTARV